MADSEAFPSPVQDANVQPLPGKALSRAQRGHLIAVSTITHQAEHGIELL